VTFDPDKIKWTQGLAIYDHPAKELIVNREQYPSDAVFVREPPRSHLLDSEGRRWLLDGSGEVA